MDWILRNKHADSKALAKELSLSEVICKVLVNRGLLDAQSIKEFLSTDAGVLHSPKLLMNCEEAAERILDAVFLHRSIRIIGDYDVDGIMSTYILYVTLKRLGAVVDYEIPDRSTDGYGMNLRMVEEAGQSNVALLLTCDNGIAAADAIAHAKALGIEVVVTDHHEVPITKEGEEKRYILPPADCIVNPHQPGDTYPEPNICGAVVAFKVVRLLLEKAGQSDTKEFLEELLVMATLATVCDVMPLVGENRTLVKQGLALLQHCPNVGIQALLTACGLKDQAITAYHAGFILGPCFNATGRLQSALLSLELLRSSDKECALAMAEKFKELNVLRKTLTVEATTAATAIAESKLSEGKCVLVIFLPECHESIAGIVAGRIREKFFRPTIVLTRGEHGVKGSGRSIPGYSMFERLSEHKDLFLAFGGHPMAAGLSLSEDKVPILEERLNQSLGSANELMTEKLYLDAVLPFSQITEKLITELSLLEPFGNGNEEPVFAASGVLVLTMKRMGKDGTHMRLTLNDGSGVQVSGLLFHRADEFEAFVIREYGEETCAKLLDRGTGQPVRLSIAFSPSINEYQGRRYPQVIIRAYKRTAD